MKSSSKLLITAVAALAAAVAIVLLQDHDSAGETPPRPLPGVESAAPTDPVPPKSTGDAAAAKAGTQEPEIERRPLPPTDEGRTAPQGMRGRLVDPHGSPIADAEILLFEGHARQPLTALLAARRGVVAPPIARAESDEHGEFALGVQRVTPGGYELRIAHPDFAHRAVPEVTLFPDRWIRLDDITLDPGVTVEGRVTVQGGSGLPVAGATVTVVPAGALPTVDVLGVRESGRTATSDAGGSYRVEHCADGLATVSAVAPGFARRDRQSVQLSRETQNRIDFELPKGESIAGVVTDPRGAAIGGAAVDAFALSAKTPMRLSARSDADGHFEVIGLVPGPYQLTVVAPGFVAEKIQPVSAGGHDEHVVLHRQSTLEVLVRAKNGRAVDRYDLELKSYDAERDQIGHVPTARLHRVLPDDLRDGRYPLADVDPGQYVVQVEASGFAKTFSAPFEVPRDGSPVAVDVTLLEGGQIIGVVLGGDGRPLADAEVGTLPNHHEDTVFKRMFDGMVPDRITRDTTRTDADGRFHFDRLAPGRYQLRLRHPANSELEVNDVVVEEGRTTDAGEIRMDRGAELTGTARLDGVPTGQIRVQVSSLPDPSRPSAPSFQAETVTDDRGEFRLPRRLPPGRYQARAARQTVPTPLLQVLDFSKTRQDFQIVRGQESQQVHFTLSSN